jgi:hypothetical protein
MDWFRIPVGDWADAGLDWAKDNLAIVFDGLDTGFDWMVTSLTDVLLWVPALVLIAIFALIGWALRSWQLALGTVISFLLILAMDVWTSAMQTFALVLVAALIAIVIAIPLGILMARNATARAVLRPVLDFMQTMPAYVYLIPAIIFFGIGVVPGVVATIIFSLPPGVRFTELGIRGVDARADSARHPAAACCAHHHGWHQPGDHAVALDGGHRRNRGRRWPRKGRRRVDLDPQRAAGRRSGTRRGHPRDLPRSRDLGPRNARGSPAVVASRRRAPPHRARRPRRPQRQLGTPTTCAQRRSRGALTSPHRREQPEKGHSHAEWTHFAP